MLHIYYTATILPALESWNRRLHSFEQWQVTVATIKHMLLDHARTLAECLVFMFNFDCTIDDLAQHKQWHNFRSQISRIFIQEVK